MKINLSWWQIALLVGCFGMVVVVLTFAPQPPVSTETVQASDEGSKPQREVSAELQDGNSTSLVTAIDPAPAATSEQRLPPSLEKTKLLLNDAKQLLAGAQRIASDWRTDSSGEAHWEFIGTDIRSWRTHEEAWKATVEILARSIVDSKEPLDARLWPAVQDMVMAETWLWKSTDSAAHCSSKLAHEYARAAKMAIERSEKVLNKRISADSEQAIIDVPDFISKADEQECKCQD